MRQINLLIIHCSATKESQPFTLQALEASHRKRGFNGIGYHYYIRQSGEVINTRPLSRIGAHVKGYMMKQQNVYINTIAVTGDTSFSFTGRVLKSFLPATYEDELNEKWVDTECRYVYSADPGTTNEQSSTNKNIHYPF